MLFIFSNELIIFFVWVKLQSFFLSVKSFLSTVERVKYAEKRRVVYRNVGKFHVVVKFYVVEIARRKDHVLQPVFRRRVVRAEIETRKSRFVRPKTQAFDKRRPALVKETFGKSQPRRFAVGKPKFGKDAFVERASRQLACGEKRVGKTAPDEANVGKFASVEGAFVPSAFFKI
jgi:hypothetical protein